MKKTFLKAFTAVIAVLALSLNVFAAGSIVLDQCCDTETLCHYY